MLKSLHLFALTAVLATLTACAKPPSPKDYTAFNQTAPRSILVVPATNKSTQVDAPDNFLVTLTVPLAERGYYVFPVNMVKRMMEDNGLGDANMVQAADARRLAGLFGADAVLYCEIVKWDAQYLVISASTTVSVHYTLKSGRTGEVIWDQTITTTYSPNGGGGGGIAGLIAGAIKAAVERASPSYIPVANMANNVAIYTKGQGIPPGPYDPAYKK